MRRPWILLVAAIASSACASVGTATLPPGDAPFAERRAAYAVLREEEDDHETAGDSARLLPLVDPSSDTAIEARQAAEASKTAELFLLAGATTLGSSCVVGLAGVGAGIALTMRGGPKHDELGMNLGVSSGGLAIAGSALGAALLLPGVYSWVRAVDHDVAAFSTYDEDLRAALHLDEQEARLSALPPLLP